MSGLPMPPVAANYGSDYPHRRSDLVWARGGATSAASFREADSVWVVKDPIAVKYFRLRHDERFVLELLNGRRAAKEIRDRYNAAFPPMRVTTAQIQQLILRFCQDGLALSASPEFFRTLLTKRQRLGITQWKQWFTAWLFVRFPGIYADPIVSRLELLLRPCLGVVGLILACCAIVVSLLWLVTHTEQFWSDASQLSRWASAYGVISLSVAIATAKTLHELGHGVACRRFGGECHEIGMLLMCCIPCLYCDTSDAWLIRSVGRRQAVNLAGVFVELLVASVAVLVWAGTHSGFLHWLSVDLILVCMISSILFNGNPLLRYDGYYVLADGLQVENLAIESRQRLNRVIRRCLWGEDRPVWPERSTKMQFVLVVYAALSLLYRCAIMLGLAWLAIVACRALGHERLGWQLVIAGAITMSAVSWGPPLADSWRRYRTNRWRRRSRSGKWLRPLIIVSSMVGLASLILLLPTAQTLTVNGHVHRPQRFPVVTSAAGVLTRWHDYGSTTAEGEVLVELENSELELELLQAKQEMIAQRALVETLERSVVSDPHLADQLPTARSLLESLVQQVDSAQRRVDRLVMRAAKPGVWIEPLRADKQADQYAIGQQLGGWTGLPLEAKQQSCFIEAGTVIGWICAGDSAKVVVLVDESSVQWVRVGQQADVRLTSLPNQTFAARVTEIGLEPTEELTPRAATSPGVISSAGDSGQVASSSRAASSGSGGSLEKSRLKTAWNSYWVTLELDTASQLIEVNQGIMSIDGLDARAVINIGQQSLASRAWRWLSGQIRF